MMFKLNDLNLYRVLDLSTGHISLTASLALGDTESSLNQDIAVTPFEYGWVIWLATDIDSMELAEFPELRDILAFAEANKFQAVKLDCDGPELEGAPVFDWDV